MKLTLSLISPDRQFSKASRAAHAELLAFERAFEALDLSATPLDLLSVLIDGGGDQDKCVVVTGEARRFSLEVALGSPVGAEDINAGLAQSISRALALAPFEGSDRQTAMASWEQWWDAAFPGIARPSAAPAVQPMIVRFEDRHPGLAALDRCTTPVAEVFKRYESCFSDAMDVLNAYAEWRIAGKQANGFLDRQLASWEVRVQIPAYPERMVRRMVEQGGPQLSIHDDAVISSALAQMIVDSKLLPSVGTRARVCVERQLMPVVMASRGASPEVKEVLEAVRDVLTPASKRRLKDA